MNSEYELNHSPRLNKSDEEDVSTVDLTSP